MTTLLQRFIVTATLPLAALAGCVTEPTQGTERAPAQVGGSFSIGGFQLMKPAEDEGSMARGAISSGPAPVSEPRA